MKKPLIPRFVRRGRSAWICGFLSTLLVSVCVAGPVGAADQNEPTYQGRTLSDWTHDLDPHGRHDPRARTAIGHMGTNAIPTLLTWMSEPDPPEPLKTNVAPCFNTSRSQRAEMAFAILGEAARPAISELTRLARTSSDRTRVERYVDCLACIGPEAIPNLLSLATNDPPVTRWYAFHALQRFTFSPAAAALVPVLINCLGDEREDVVSEAASVLCLFAFDLPIDVLPALSNALHSSSALTRSWAVHCLGCQDKMAVSAIPLLRAAMRDPAYEVRHSATNVLRSMGGWQLDREGRWFRVHGTNVLHGITPDFFSDAPR